MTSSSTIHLLHGAANSDKGLYPLGKLVDKNTIPFELASIAQFVLFMGKLVEKRYSTKKPRITKQPRRVLAPKYPASINKPHQWGTLDQAFTSLAKNKDSLEKESLSNGCPGFFGIGFVLTKPLCITAYDIDNVVNKDTGEIHPFALKLIDEIDSYTEWSPSGEGLRILVSGSIPSNVKTTLSNGIGFEMYDCKRYVTITGDVYRV